MKHYEYLRTACEQGNDKQITLLLTKYGPNYCNKKGETFLFHACRHGHIRVIDVLLQHPEVNVNQPNHHDNTPLSEAAYHGHVHAVKLLLNHADICLNKHSHPSGHPLARAWQNNHHTIYNLLRSKWPNDDRFATYVWNAVGVYQERKKGGKAGGHYEMAERLMREHLPAITTQLRTEFPKLPHLEQLLAFLQEPPHELENKDPHTLAIGSSAYYKLGIHHHAVYCLFTRERDEYAVDYIDRGAMSVHIKAHSKKTPIIIPTVRIPKHEIGTFIANLQTCNNLEPHDAKKLLFPKGKPLLFAGYTYQNELKLELKKLHTGICWEANYKALQRVKDIRAMQKHNVEREWGDYFYKLWTTAYREVVLQHFKSEVSPEMYQKGLAHIQKRTIVDALTYSSLNSHSFFPHATSKKPMEIRKGWQEVAVCSLTQ